MGYKSWVGKMKDKMEELLDKSDLEGLYRMGAPEHEYDSEARKITMDILGRYILCQTNVTEKDVCRIISEVFNDQFGELESHKPTDKKIIKIAKAFKKWENNPSRD